jgi:hypothetical protein
VSETSEPKITRKGVPIALGIICIILAACLAGGIAAYAMMSVRAGNTISSLKDVVSLGVNEQLGLQLTMALQKTNYGLGEPISITLTLTNISNQTISFWLDFSFSYFEFKVYNGTNSILYSSLNNGGIQLPLAVVYTLNAEESLSANLVWNQTYNNNGFSPEGIPVLPGTYYIVGQVGPIYYGTNSTIETTPIQVTIG